MSDSKYSVDRAVTALHKNGARISAAKVIEVKKGTLGIKLLGLVDFLTKFHGFTAKFTTPAPPKTDNA